MKALYFSRMPFSEFARLPESVLSLGKWPLNSRNEMLTSSVEKCAQWLYGDCKTPVDEEVGGSIR